MSRRLAFGRAQASFRRRCHAFLGDDATPFLDMASFRRQLAATGALGREKISAIEWRAAMAAGFLFSAPAVG